MAGSGPTGPSCRGPRTTRRSSRKRSGGRCSGCLYAAGYTYRSDKGEGPTAGTETVDALEFLARVLTHIPDKGQVTTRYYGWYANRPRGMRRLEAERRAEAAGTTVVVVPPRALAPTEASRRW